MDNDELVSEVQRGESNGEDLRGTSEHSDIERVTLNDLHLLKFHTLEEIQDILQRYVSLDIPKDHPALFQEYLISRRDTWFVEAGKAGLIYLTHVLPRIGATLNVIFWDGHLTKDRREATKVTVATAFDLFELPRISALCPITNAPLRQMYKKIGFALEGVVRKGYLAPDGGYLDMVLFGLIDEEVKQWPVPRAHKISSE